MLLVLFLPVPYHVWVNGDLAQPDEFVYRIKILGIQILPKKERRPHRKKRRQLKKQAQPNAVDQTVDSEASNSKKSDAASEFQPLKDDQQTAVSEQKERNTEKKQKRQKAAPKKEKHRSAQNIRATWERVQAELTDEGNHRAFRHVFSELRYLLSHYGPGRVRADIIFSLGDPANTGYVTALLSVCPFSYGKDTRIIPDFEIQELYLRGWLDVRGHVRTIHVLIAGLRLLLDKDIQGVWKKVVKKK